MAQLGSKCLYVLQSKAREGGRERRREESRVLRERIRSDILRASSRNHLPSFSSSDPPRCVELEGELEALVFCTRENCGFAEARTRPTLRIIAPPVCSLITCSVTGGGGKRVSTIRGSIDCYPRIIYLLVRAKRGSYLCDKNSSPRVRWLKRILVIFRYGIYFSDIVIVKRERRNVPSSNSFVV